VTISLNIQGKWELPVTISLNIQGRWSSVSWIALSWDGERDSRGGFDRIGAEAPFVGNAWALSLVYFGCTEIVLIDTTGL
jgi:hypothetical protein